MSRIDRICGACGRPMDQMLERPVSRTQSYASAPSENTALKIALHRFIGKYGGSSPELLERAQRQWYSSNSERARLLDECDQDFALLEACEIVVMAGPEAAQFLPLFARQARLGSRIDFRA